MTAENTQRSALATFLFFGVYVRETVSFISALFGLSVDAPQVMHGGGIAWAVIRLIALVGFAGALWWLPPPSRWGKPLSAWLEGWLGDPHTNRWLYCVLAFIGGLISMAGIVTAATKETGAGAVGLALLVGISAFFTTYLVSVAARSDTTPLENTINDLTKERDGHKEQFEAQANLVNLSKKRVREVLEGYRDSGEKTLKEWRNNDITLEQARAQFRQWRPLVLAVTESSPFTVSSRVAEIRQPSTVPLDIRQGTPDEPFYKEFRAELDWLEDVIQKRLKLNGAPTNTDPPARPSSAEQQRELLKGLIESGQRVHTLEELFRWTAEAMGGIRALYGDVEASRAFDMIPGSEAQAQALGHDANTMHDPAWIGATRDHAINYLRVKMASIG